MDGQRLLGITGGDGPGGSALTERIVAYDGALCRPFCRTDRGAVQKWPLRGSVPGPCFRGASARSLLGSLQRSEEPTSELQSLMRTSYAVCCLKIKNNKH